MDEKIKATIEKVHLLAQQNAEFGEELRKRLNIASASSVLAEDERINTIYEYCIEKVIRQQALEFYKDFPLKSIKDTLIEDFVRMESFRRKDNFGDFCLALYQQIECMTNKLCENSDLAEITNKMWGHPAYIKSDKQKFLDNRTGTYTIAKMVFISDSSAFEKSKSALQTQYAIDKIRIVVYFLGYKAMMENSDYGSYIEITSLLSDIYQCRNMNHRGNRQKEKEEATFKKIIPLKSLYYFKFLGVLAQYVEYVKDGYAYMPTIVEYCKTISPQKVEGASVKIVDKISEEELKRRLPRKR